MPDVVLIGGGGHAKVVAESLLLGGYGLIGYTAPAETGLSESGVAWLGDDSRLAQLATTHRLAFIAVGDNARRADLAQRAIDLGFVLVNAIHPAAVVSPRCRLEDGIAVMAGAVVNAGTAIARGCIVNTNSSVDHDCSLAPFVHVAPGCRLSGYVEVGAGALLGIGSVVGRGAPLRVGAGATVGAGSVVIRDVPRGSCVIGAPAKLRVQRQT
jgi:UDP-perosamine 4-acetyltransferase